MVNCEEFFETPGLSCPRLDQQIKHEIVDWV